MQPTKHDAFLIGTARAKRERFRVASPAASPIVIAVTDTHANEKIDDATEWGLLKMKHLDLRPEDIEALVEFRLSRLPGIARQDPDAARAAIRKELEGLDNLASPEKCREVAARKIAGEQPSEAYAERVVRLFSGRFATAGIRFLNMQPFPYVELQGNFSFLEAADLEDFGRAARELFSSFKPRGFLFRDRMSAPALRNQRWEVWDCVIGGPLPPSELAEDTPAGLEIVKADVFAPYATYLTEYAEWAAETPELAPHLRTESKEDLDRSAKAGLLYEVRFEGQWAGVIAAHERPYYGRPAIYLFEKFLTKDARGLGLSKFVENMFLKKMAPRYSWVWGLIYRKNLPSLRSSLPQGRVPMEASYFVAY